MPSSARKRAGGVGASRTPTRGPQRLELLAVGGLLAASGQLILSATPLNADDLGTRQLIAGVLLMTGAVIFGYLTGIQEKLPASVDSSARSSGPRGVPVTPPLELALCVLPGALAIVLFAKLGDSAPVTALWIASPVSLLGSQLRGTKLRLPLSSRAALPHFLLLAAVLIVALAARAYRLSTLPWNFDGDFASFGLQARALIDGSEPQIFRFGWASIPIPGYFPAALSMMLFGDNVLGLNASGVFAGILSIIGVYLLGREFFGPRVGLISAALLTVSYAHIAASRQSAFLDPVPFVVFAIYFFLKGIREEGGWAIVASGICTALCLDLYYSGRIVLPVLMVLIGYLAFVEPDLLRRRARSLLIWSLALLISLGPMLVVIARYSDAFITRSREVFILEPSVVRHTMGVFGVETIPAMLLEQARRTALMFHQYVDNDTQFSFRRPLLDPVSAVLFTLGLGTAAFRLRRIGPFLLLAWIALGVFIGGFLTVNVPFWTRLMVLLPPAAMLAALALEELYLWASGTAAGRIHAPQRRLLAGFFLAGLLVITGIRNWNTYVEAKGSYAEGRAWIGRYLAEQTPQTHAYLVTSADWSIQDRIFQFLAPGVFVDKIPPEQLLTATDQLDDSSLLILTSEQAPLLERVVLEYPAATIETGGGNSPGQPAFYAVRPR